MDNGHNKWGCLSKKDVNCKEGRVEASLPVWETFFYKQGNGFDIYGYWYSYDSNKWEYLDWKSNLCFGEFDENTKILKITDPFGTCPYVSEGWDSAEVTLDSNGQP